MFPACDRVLTTLDLADVEDAVLNQLGPMVDEKLPPHPWLQLLRLVAPIDARILPINVLIRLQGRLRITPARAKSVLDLVEQVADLH